MMMYVMLFVSRSTASRTDGRRLLNELGTFSSRSRLPGRAQSTSQSTRTNTRKRTRKRVEPQRLRDDMSCGTGVGASSTHSFLGNGVGLIPCRFLFVFPFFCPCLSCCLMVLSLTRARLCPLVVVLVGWGLFERCAVRRSHSCRSLELVAQFSPPKSGVDGWCWGVSHRFPPP